MKYIYRKKIWKILIYGFITKIEDVTGITSITNEKDMHFVLWDFDNTTFNNVQLSLFYVAEKYDLKNIVIMTDKKDSYRAFSPSKVHFRTLLKILLDTDNVDNKFIEWTFRRGYATIRMSKKKHRNKMKIENIIKYDGEYIPQIENFKFVEYESDMDRLL